jgi:hypothetical protein
MPKYFLQYFITAQQHVVVPESNHSPTSAFERFGPSNIGRHAIGVLTSIELDDQVPLDTREVGEVGTHGVLSAKSMVRKPAISQPVPKHTFRVGSMVPKLTGAIARP